ncbi:MAG: hypothetical protein ACYTAF_04320 [Planctomycetota bacterium]|jgi:hypothetical protein
MRAFTVIIMLLLACGLAAGDEVTLKNGGKVVGIVKEKGDKVIVEVGVGTITFHKDDVLTIKRGRTPLHEYRDRAAKVGNSKKASDHFELAKFCRENSLGRYVRGHLQRVIELEPDHEAARRALGFQLYKGKWMTRDEVYQERGFVKFEGKWLTPAEVELIKKHRLEMEEKRLAVAEERRQRREEEKRRREEMKRRYYEQILEMQRQYELQRLARRYYGGGYYGGGYYGGNYGPYSPYAGRYYGGGVLPTVNVFDMIPNPYAGNVNPYGKK